MSSGSIGAAWVKQAFSLGFSAITGAGAIYFLKLANYDPLAEACTERGVFGSTVAACVNANGSTMGGLVGPNWELACFLIAGLVYVVLVVLFYEFRPDDL